VEELDIPELNSKQTEQLSLIVEKTAAQYVLSIVPSKRIETLNISVETEGTKPVTLTVDVNISLSPLMRNFDAQKLTDEAVREAIVAAENFLRELTCHSKR